MAKGADSSPPWWLPLDFEEKDGRLAEAMTEALTPKMQMQLLHMPEGRVSKKIQTDVVQAIFMGMSRSPDYRLELARHALMKPLDMARIQSSMCPKTVEVEGEIRHHHAIVVPELLSDEQWNRGQAVLGEVLDEGWSETSPWGDLSGSLVTKEEEEF